MNTKYYCGMLLADLHFGATPPDTLRNELQLIIDHIDKMERLNFIVFLGDVFDHKMYLNDPSIGVMISFMNQIMSISRERRIKIRIVYGTESHECDQYNIFSVFESSENLDLKIIKSVSEEELFENFHVLYLPEEYITEKKSDYYSEYFSKKNKYDYVFGHGVITEVMTMIKREKEENLTRSKSPKFTTADFKRCCHGKVYFGHYHINSSMDNFAYYVGSFSRWVHGEESPKGFYQILYDVNTKKYTEEFIENEMAIMYKTYTFGYSHDIFNGDENLINHIKTINNLIEKHNKFDHVRFVFNIPEDYENPEFFMSHVKENFKLQDKISLEFVNGYIEKKHMIDKQELADVIDHYDYILKKDDSIGNTVSKFIEDTNGRCIDPGRINSYIHQNIQDIIAQRLVT